jgi:two-component system response regulator
MKDVVLVDSQAARVRRFREAVALYRHTFLPLQRSTARTQQQARELVERARRTRQARRGEEIRLHVFPSGAEALKFLRREEPYTWAPRPAVVFTDLYLDRAGGAAFVKSLKADPALKPLPAVVLCSKAAPDQIREAWEAGCNAVVDLPWDGSDGLHRVRETLSFWLSEAVPPP